MSQLPELDELFEVVKDFQGLARTEELGHVSDKGATFPIIGMSIGSTDPTTPVLGLFGGVHGLERIGTKVILSYLRTLAQLLRWDALTKSYFEKGRLVVIPLVNPVGMFLQRRSNGNGVDLMRNSPVRAEGVPGYYLFGGHRISPALPWYQGVEGGAMEIEAQIVCNFVRQKLFTSSFSISVDVHSGYGSKDRFWFPYAKTKKPFGNLAEVYALKTLLDRTYPNHVYRVEPQSSEYLTHGDLWDFLYDEHVQRKSSSIFIPFSLELGSWLWVKKNIRQLYSMLGVFNPLAPHRLQRTLRRHMALFDFLHRAVISHQEWAKISESDREKLVRQATSEWY